MLNGIFATRYSLESSDILAMWDLASSAVQNALSYVAAFALRWYWSEKRLASRVRTTVRSENEGIRIDGGEVPEFYAWLEVQNLTPFPIDVDRLYGEVYCAGRIASFVWLERKQIASLQAEMVYVHADMTDAQARHLSRTVEMDKVRVVLGGYVTCRVRGFALFRREIVSSNVQIINVKKAAF